MNTKNYKTITINVDDAMIERLNREGQRMALANELSTLLERIYNAGFRLEVRDSSVSWEEARRQNLFTDKLSLPLSLFADKTSISL
jgi:hypothetical protein